MTKIKPYTNNKMRKQQTFSLSNHNLMGFLNGGLICLLNFNARIREFTIVSLELKEDNIPINLGMRLSGQLNQRFREVKSERLD